MSIHPNSLKNLNPYVKGVSGFAGRVRKKLPDDLKDVKALTQCEVNRLISKYARMLQMALDEKLQDPKTPVLELAIGKIFAQSIKYGDYARLNFLLERCIGKIPEVEEDDEDMDSREEIARLSMTELLTLVKSNIPTESKE